MRCMFFGIPREEKNSKEFSQGPDHRKKPFDSTETLTQLLCDRLTRLAELISVRYFFDCIPVTDDIERGGLSPCQAMQVAQIWIEILVSVQISWFKVYCKDSLHQLDLASNYSLNRDRIWTVDCNESFRWTRTRSPTDLIPDRTLRNWTADLNLPSCISSQRFQVIAALVCFFV